MSQLNKVLAVKLFRVYGVIPASKFTPRPEKSAGGFFFWGNEMDSFSLSGATRLAKTIEDHWKALGYRNVKASPYVISSSRKNVPDYGIRSNLINGMPPAETARMAA